MREYRRFPGRADAGKRRLRSTVPRASLIAAIAHPDPAAAERAFEAMMEMTKIDITAIEAALRG